MPDIRQLLHVLRKGARPQRLQAWGGLVLFLGAALWLLYNLLPLLAGAVVALIGIVLIRRAIRGLPPSP